MLAYALFLSLNCNVNKIYMFYSIILSDFTSLSLSLSLSNSIS